MYTRIGWKSYGQWSNRERPKITERNRVGELRRTVHLGAIFESATITFDASGNARS